MSVPFVLLLQKGKQWWNVIDTAFDSRPTSNRPDKRGYLLYRRNQMARMGRHSKKNPFLQEVTFRDGRRKSEKICPWIHKGDHFIDAEFRDPANPPDNGIGKDVQIFPTAGSCRAIPPPGRRTPIFPRRVDYTVHFRFQDNCAKRIIVADFNGGTVDGRKPDEALFPEISQVGFGLSPCVPVPHAVDFRGKIVPYTRGSIAGKDEQDLAIAEISWPILLAHNKVTFSRGIIQGDLRFVSLRA
jgi:hypothetical protein